MNIIGTEFRSKLAIVTVASLVGGALYLILSMISYTAEGRLNPNLDGLLFSMAVTAIYSISFGVLFGLPILFAAEKISVTNRKCMLYLISGGFLQHHWNCFFSSAW